MRSRRDLTRSVWTAFEKKFYVAHGFGIDLGRGQSITHGTQATLYIKLQARTRMIARQIHFAGWDQEVAVDQIDNAIGKIGWEVRAIVGAAIFAQAAGYVDARIALG